MFSYDPINVLKIMGFGVFLWLALYLLTRALQRTPLIIVSLIGLFTQASFFLSDILLSNTTNVTQYMTLFRLSWWNEVIPMAVWFHMSSLIVRRKDHNAATFPLLVLMVYAVALVIVLVGTGSNLFLDYTVSRPSIHCCYIPAGSAFILYIAFLMIVGVAALINLISSLVATMRYREKTNREMIVQLRLLVGGAFMFLAGALWISSRFQWHLELVLPPQPAYVFLLLGLACLGYGIDHFGLLLEGQDARRDFIYSFTGVVLVNLLFVTVLALTGLHSIYGFLALVGLVTLLYTTIDGGHRVLDTFFFNETEQEARAQAREYVIALGSSPTTTDTLVGATVQNPKVRDESRSVSSATATSQHALSIIAEDLLPSIEVKSRKAFNDIVRKAITSLKNPPQLVKSPLLSLRLVEQRVRSSDLEDNRLNRAAALREILVGQIEQMQPNDNTPATSRVGDAWRFYNVLYYPYVREISRKSALNEARRLSDIRHRTGQREPSQIEQVLNWLIDIDEDTFYKWQRRASDTIAITLWEEELKCSEAVS